MIVFHILGYYSHISTLADVQEKVQVNHFIKILHVDRSLYHILLGVWY